jgi:signal transduction histidine kinase
MPATHRLLAFAKELQNATTFQELLAATRREALAVAGYPHVWLFVADREPVEQVRLIDAASSERGAIWDVAPVLTIAGDAMMEEIVRGEAPVVVEDARTDPRTNKDIVRQLGNRTIVNIPLRPLDKPFGAFGCGTFGDEEGCRPPTAETLAYLVGMASQLAVAAGRIRFAEERARRDREIEEMERRMAQFDRLESLGLLAGGVAHDFNNLLTIILASAGMARREIGAHAASVHVDTILDTADRGRELTKHLLEMIRARPHDIRPIDVNDRLDRLVTLLRRVMPRNIELELVRGAGLPLVEGDGAQLDQMFMNLCINARDAMEKGGRLRIATEPCVLDAAGVTDPSAKPGPYVLATVSDTGAGMPPGVVERVFEPFFTTKQDSTGTGLGLTVSQGVVRQHGGVIDCQSEVGVGTSFRVYLPAMPAH